MMIEEELRKAATIPGDFDIIEGTTAVKGRWFCIVAIGDNTTFGATGMQVNGVDKDMTAWNGNFLNGMPIYGNFTQIQLASANSKVHAYKLVG